MANKEWYIGMLSYLAADHKIFSKDYVGESTHIPLLRLTDNQDDFFTGLALLNHK